ncbi:MAG: YibE/F family protein [Lachnospiraceae bacterium]|jgi:uncharacterized membrane protein|nr:YibE/F family protein [Lachnospiraceae bacterium]
MSVILILLLIFIVLFVAVGGDRGVVSLITLIGNAVIFILCTIFMSANIPAILVTIIASVGISALTLFYQNGRNVKTYSAMISLVIVMVILLLMTIIIGLQMELGGLNEIELKSDMVQFYTFDFHVDLRYVMIGVIIIGLLGAVLDTTVAISSGLYEVYEHNKDLNQKELFKSGIKIGKDILSTTFNTLYFAYIGEALMLIVYLQEYNYTFIEIINSKAFLAEFVCIIFSAIGCTLVIPINAYIASRVYKSSTFFNQ